MSERAIRLTDAGSAPWHIIEATDNRYRDLSVGQTLISTLERQLRGGAGIADPAGRLEEDELDSVLTRTLADGQSRITVLDRVDLTHSLTAGEYEERINRAQTRLYQLSWAMYRQKKNAVLVFEGWDAAGKGSAIRRVTGAMDARLYRVIPIAAPTDNDMVAHTGTVKAPWTLVSGNDKKFARVQILDTVCERLESVIERD